jgi:uncharacterized protein YbjT (DUF2867 family)
VIRLPWGSDSTLIPLVAAEDVARVVTELVTAPSLLAGAAYPLIGAVLTVREIIETFGRVLGRDVRYEQISDEEWRRGALSVGINQHAVEHLSQLWRFLRESGVGPEYAQVTDAIEKLGGEKPKTLDGFLREGD